MRRALFSGALIALIATLTFMLFEGFMSVVLLASDLVKSSSEPTEALAERRHTRYDPELGWVNLPSVEIEDMYGPGISLRTNGQGFRNDVDFTEEVPPGVVRIICCGDSFTLGYGVSNDDTWCSQLDVPGVELERVNVGQGGYGVHQAYLWYMRDGRKLKHQILLFAFINLDFERMRQTTFVGYGTPRLRRGRSGDLEVTNVPVPQIKYRFPWLYQNGGHFLRLRTAQALTAWFGEDTQDELAWSEVFATSYQIFDNLIDEQRRAGGDTIFVYLPTSSDVTGLSSTRRRVSRYLTQRGYPLLDLSEPFRETPPEEAMKLFINEGEVDFPGATGHYSVEGNRVVADLISSALAEHPIVRAATSRADPGSR